MKHQMRYKKGIYLGARKLIKKQEGKESEAKLRGVLKHVPPLTRSKRDMAKWLNR